MRKEMITVTELKYNLKKHFRELNAEGGCKIVHRHGQQLVVLLPARALPDIEDALDRLYPETYSTLRAKPPAGSRVVKRHIPKEEKSS